MSELEAAESLVRYARAIRRAQRFLIVCLILVILGLSGILVVTISQYNNQQAQFEKQTHRYQVAKEDRADIQRKLDATLELLREERAQ